LGKGMGRVVNVLKHASCPHPLHPHLE
jgi:hypothetical protein